jgi:hypothetical protein
MLLCVKYLIRGAGKIRGSEGSKLTFVVLREKSRGQVAKDDVNSGHRTANSVYRRFALRRTGI